MRVLKVIRKFAINVSEAFDLPEAALAGSAHVEITAGKNLLVENYRGLISYEKNNICILVPEGKLNVWGTELGICLMTGSEIAVKGKISSMEWDG